MYVNSDFSSGKVFNNFSYFKMLTKTLDNSQFTNRSVFAE